MGSPAIFLELALENSLHIAGYFGNNESPRDSSRAGFPRRIPDHEAFPASGSTAVRSGGYLRCCGRYERLSNRRWSIALSDTSWMLPS